MKKILIPITSRAGYGRLKALIKRMQEDADIEPIVIVCASASLPHYGRLLDIIISDGITIYGTTKNIIENDEPSSMAISVGLLIVELVGIIEQHKPDWVLCHADRYEMLAAAIAASYMNIPVAHTQGGEITGSIDESVRHAITKLSHLHFTATEQARKNVIQMGEHPLYVYNTGCPSIDLIKNMDLSLPDDIFERGLGVGQMLDHKKPYIVVLQHPVTTEYGQGHLQILETLNAVRNINMQTVWLWPNIDAGRESINKVLRQFHERNPDAEIHFYRNFSPEDYARLIANCRCLVGNSSSGIREGSYLGVPVVNIGTRQQFREKAGNVINTGYSTKAIEEAIIFQINSEYKTSDMYGDGTASSAICENLKHINPEIQKSFNFIGDSHAE